MSKPTPNLAVAKALNWPLDTPCRVLWAALAAPNRSSVHCIWLPGQLLALHFDRTGQLYAVVRGCTPGGCMVVRLMRLDTLEIDPLDHPLFELLDPDHNTLRPGRGGEI